MYLAELGARDNICNNATIPQCRQAENVLLGAMESGKWWVVSDEGWVVSSEWWMVSGG